MYSCEAHNMLGYKTCLILRKTPIATFNHSARNSFKFRCLLDQLVPKFAVLSSLSSVFTSGNVIALAATAGSGSVHGAVTVAITDVAVTAVAIASGACLSTKIDFLWPKVEEQPGSLILDGVDVTEYPIFSDSKVQKAIAFARKAHQGQFRKTGDPYLTHCIHTAKILAVLVPSTGKRAVDTVIAGILHDVVDDTCESLDSIVKEFDEDIAKLVAGVSKLSYINQLLRRHRRVNVNQEALRPEESWYRNINVSDGSMAERTFRTLVANNLRVMLLGMVDDPRVVLIKLADRLHNMRTIYALPSAKAQAVAQETLVIWCSLASRLGLWALKAELEDLCFAVLQPEVFRQMRANLASMWSCSKREGKLRRLAAKSNAKNSILGPEESMPSSDDDITMKDLLQAVLPFDLMLDRGKRIKFSNAFGTSSETQTKPKVVRDAGIALSSMVLCEEALERELFISTSYVPGMEVTLSSRLKSLYSIYSKMQRKDVGIQEIYDARALRVIVGDNNGTLHGQAVQGCYNLLNIVHRLWIPINGELDDYIVNPKPSGYQSLHTAVQGPDSSPLEVQIRTQRMHEYAEHGVAAHWLYKEAGSALPLKSDIIDSGMVSPYSSNEMEDQNSVEGVSPHKYGFLKPGHPVLRVEGSNLLAAVIVRVDQGGKELLVAVSFALAASEAVADRRSSYQLKRWEAYAMLHKKVSDEWWCEPGHGDWCTCLEKYTLCRDGIYHKQDQFERHLPTFIQVIDLTEEEETRYWDVVAAVFEGKQVESVVSNSSCYSNPGSGPINTDSMDCGINNKVHLLRTMLQWEEQLCSEAGFQQSNKYVKMANSVSNGEVVVVCWPNGDIMRLRTGSTAADAARRAGIDGKLVAVNGHPVLPNTQLKDGDVIELRK